MVWKPLRHDGYRRRVAEPIAQAHDDSEPEVEPAERRRVGAHEEAETNEKSPGQRDPERSEPVLEPAREDEAESEHGDRDRERGRGLGALPPELLFQRVDEHAPGV